MDNYYSGGNMPYLEQLFEAYQNDPQSISEEWRERFATIKVPEIDSGSDVSMEAMGSSTWRLRQAHKQAAVSNLILHYRAHGHAMAKLDPLNLVVPSRNKSSYSEFGLEEDDKGYEFDTGSFIPGFEGNMPLLDIISHAEDIYCSSVGFEYMYITDDQQKKWIQNRIEVIPAFPKPSKKVRIALLQKLIAAETLERYLHNKYVGQKRFSLEGCESLMNVLNDLIQDGGEKKIEEIIIGMAHRGRVNVLVNTLGKSPADLFAEFEGNHDFAEDAMASGDVKYHQGFSSDILTPGGSVHVALAFNPSHLEIISPVVEGSVRARQQQRGDRKYNSILPIIVHGDAAFAGQGVVMETFNMSQSRGYSTGGTIHVVVNNQIGFTTSNPLDARSTLYCTEVAKMVQAPIFHVNADNPEAVHFITKLALDFRMHFNKDVVVDLVCYRRHGHNEADEPAVTQPVMYKRIKETPTITSTYAKQLIAEELITESKVQQMNLDYRDSLDQGRVVAGQVIDPGKGARMTDWTPYLQPDWDAPADTRFAAKRFQELGEALQKLPDDFTLHPRIRRLYQDREKMLNGKLACDWGFCETMAYATLLDEGWAIRLSGQDCGRGTFSHRHATVHNQNNRDTYVPLQSIPKRSSDFLVINSLLSEEAVLGFEYGYSATSPKTLVIWEAQFGDFANGAQVLIDQFITSGEAKWSRLSGLVLLLPHGYEGQGPEHSSARIERYLQLCAHYNIKVAVPSNPGQLYHILREQMVRKMRRPLVIFSPKSLLRNKLSTARISDLVAGRYRPVLPDVDIKSGSTSAKNKISRIVISSGKVFFDLLEKQRSRKEKNVALLRLEQLYPFPIPELTKEIAEYPNATDIVWCQEEPKNQGAWLQIKRRIETAMTHGQTLHYAGRDHSASPAVGTYQLHLKQQMQLINTALSGS